MLRIARRPFPVRSKVPTWVLQQRTANRAGRQWRRNFCGHEFLRHSPLSDDSWEVVAIVARNGDPGRIGADQRQNLIDDGIEQSLGIEQVDGRRRHPVQRHLSFDGSSELGFNALMFGESPGQRPKQQKEQDQGDEGQDRGVDERGPHGVPGVEQEEQAHLDCLDREDCSDCYQEENPRRLGEEL
jgi:hypothetical protein